MGQQRAGRSEVLFLAGAMWLAGLESGIAQVGAVGLILPTENDALFRGGGPTFYQYIIRDYQGEVSRPWQGGQFGFVRNPQATRAGIVYSRFHEGIDIKPVRRDAVGEPLDPVRSVAAGRVVYVSPPKSGSGYGNYVVVEHQWDGCPYYSLYGHLARATVSTGQEVNRGDQLAIMGYTGSGLDRERAHLHFEINLFLSNDFEAWHKEWFVGEQNHHGIYNGLNLAGIDVARFLLADRARPGVRVHDFLSREEVFYRVRVPGGRPLEIAKRYPWMGGADGSADAWEISFHASGLPLSVHASAIAVNEPSVIWVKDSAAPYVLQTRGMISGSGGSARLTQEGLRHLNLLTR